MDQENKAEVTGQAAEPKKRDIPNGCLVSGVFAVAVVAIGFYIYKFHGLSLSTDPGDWADFATYLSGTVGLAAVVASLLAFVKTLGQQQALINSQDQMLIDQKSQLELSERQLEQILAKEKRDIAFANFRDVLPLVMGNFKRSLEYELEPPASSNMRKVVCDLHGEEGDVFKLKNLIKKLCELNDMVGDDELDRFEFKGFVVTALGNTRWLCNFLVENIGNNSSLSYVSNSLLLEVVDDDQWTYWDYIQCHLAFMAGYYSDYEEMPECRVLEEPSDYLNSSEPHLQQFNLLGIALK